ncbi:hypothetical protein [Xanthomonas oryzae]|uniref:hypothetical protein n=2 Tax=Xanthomonas oryzae TaxID=347 RepID=UPI000AA85804|nr:hypothetical protein [Xanthomonas oryzae]UUC39195.1 hypothetical protein NO561_06930 [Xanthomonas oryzae pv. oryzae]WAY23250.1 hypothetical protein O5966_14675 [Xanthomonas oryzae pv. oryzae]WDN10364.1 hypothetical protein LL919_12335 [Xanthomonas oryzae]WDN21690.1 hypothetical protein LL930_14705 [Xanthomonas oryzae]WVN07577.1 hypothetical protein V1208_06055 [Xanthomonas oryzae pv. oryzicola]
MNRFTIKAAAFFLIFIFYGSAYAGWSRISPDTIELRGDIDQNSDVEYFKVATGGYSRIVVHSGGGYPFVALKIAEDIVRRRPIEVKVDGICLSACASYIAMAASSLTVDCGAILGWHGTLSTGKEGEAMLVAEGGPRVLATKYRDWLEKFHAEERDFYIHAGVNYKILEYAENKIINNPGSLNEYKFDEKTAEYSYTTTPSIWIPQYGTLEKYGINGKNYCRKYTPEIILNVMKKVGVKSMFILEN